MDVDDIPIILDIEASGFGRGSYPIEVGIAMPDTSAHCYLIKPQPDWTHWEQDAEAMHGISRETLERFGHGVDFVANQLSRFLKGKTAYSDAWSNDNSWLARLYDASNTLQDFRLEHLVTICTEAQLSIWDDIKQQVINEYECQRHRASTDARVLQTTWVRTLASSQVVGL